MTKEQALRAASRYAARAKKLQTKYNKLEKKLFLEDIDILKKKYGLSLDSSIPVIFVSFDEDIDEKQDTPCIIVHLDYAPKTHTVMWINGSLVSYPSDKILMCEYYETGIAEGLPHTIEEWLIDKYKIYFSHSPLHTFEWKEDNVKRDIEAMYDGFSENEKLLIERIKNEQKNRNLKTMLLHDAIIESNPEIYADL